MYRVVAIGRLVVTKNNLVPNGEQSLSQLGPKLFLVTSLPMAISLRDSIWGVLLLTMFVQ